MDFHKFKTKGECVKLHGGGAASKKKKETRRMEIMGQAYPVSPTFNRTCRDSIPTEKCLPLIKKGI